MTDESLILWDVVEEHLDEAEFLFGMWERAVVAPDYTRRDVERAFGERLRAHLDGLAVAGEPAAKRLLLPGLADGGAEASRAAACALGLLASEGDEGASRVLVALEASEAGTGLRAGIVRALEVSDRAGLDAVLRDAVYATEGAPQAVLVGVLGARGMDAGPIVGTLLRSDDPRVLVHAARAAALRPAEALRWEVTGLLDVEDEGIRMAALETALVWGLPEGWQRCWREAERGTAAALMWAGLLGGEEAVGLLRAAAARQETRHAALRALGASGWRSAAEECLRWMSDADRRTAKLAADGFGAITGVDAYAKGFSAKVAEEDELPPLDEDLVRGLEAEVEDDLPLPDAAAFARWWRENERAFTREVRYLRGQERTREAIEACFASGPMRVGQWLWWEQLARSQGTLMQGRGGEGQRRRGYSSLACTKHSP